MAKCAKCGKNILFGKLTSEGLCPDCCQQELNELRKKTADLGEQIGKLNAQVTELRSPEYQDHERLTTANNRLSSDNKKMEEKLTEQRQTLLHLEQEEKKRKDEIVVLDEEILAQDFGLYTPVYDFANSVDYKVKLERVRREQKEMAKNWKAASFNVNLTMDGSKAKGERLNKNNIKLILRSFNNECENAIDRVKYNNVDSMKKRINQSYDSLNRLMQPMGIAIKPEYLRLKMDELALAVEYAMKKQEEKEAEKQHRAELREQAKLEKEIAEARKNILKDQKHYQAALEKLNQQISSTEDGSFKDSLLEKKQQMEEKLVQLDQEMKDVDYREANQKAGYVYVISNIGAFGEGVYKIGMTRRLDPMERVYELGDASVPYNFDVHAMIFSDDAPALEAALHRAFEDRKLNMVNTRREFFRVSLDEIEEVVRKNYDKTVEFVRLPEAQQYRESEKIREAMTKKDVKTV